MYTETSFLQSFFDGFSLPSPTMSPLIAQLQEHQLGMPLAAGHLHGVSQPPVCFFPHDFYKFEPQLALFSHVSSTTLFASSVVSVGLFSSKVSGVSEFAMKLDWYSGLAFSVALFFKGNLMQSSDIFEYDFGDEGDLFKAPETITEETLLAIDPMSAGVSIVAGGDDVIINTIKVAEAIQNEMQNNHMLSEVFYECKKDLLENCAFNESVLDQSALAIPVEDLCLESGRVAAEGSLNKSFSAGSLDSREWINCPGRPNFLEFEGLDFEAAYGMRRAYSEGDIEKLENTTASFGCTYDTRSSLEQLVAMGEFKSEDRRQKLSRYMKKKTKRNFGRKIKYACRKALADCQPRVRGRFAKVEECGSYKQTK